MHAEHKEDYSELWLDLADFIAVVVISLQVTEGTSDAHVLTDSDQHALVVV